MSTDDTLDTSRQSMPKRLMLLRNLARNILDNAIELDLDGMIGELERELAALHAQIAESPDHDEDGDPWQPQLDRANATLDVARSLRNFARTAWAHRAYTG